MTKIEKLDKLRFPSHENKALHYFIGELKGTRHIDTVDEECLISGNDQKIYSKKWIQSKVKLLGLFVCGNIAAFLIFNSLFIGWHGPIHDLILKPNQCSQYQQVIEEITKPGICDYECMKKFVGSLPLIEEYHGLSVQNAKDDLEYVTAESSQCDIIPIHRRFDCASDIIDVSSETCEARGCCWKIVNSDDYSAPNINGNESNIYKPIINVNNSSIRLSVPWCFYPKNYNIYNFSEISSTKNGIEGTLRRKFKSGFPNDISLLGLEISYETCSRLRIKIFDKNQKRWETPVPKVPKSFPGCIGTKLYDVEINEQQGTIVVRRSDSGIPLFDMRNAAPLIFADQFLQLSTLLPSPFLYGLGQHLDGLLLDLYWTRRVLWNADQAPKEQDNLYGSHPFYMNIETSGTSHGLFLLNSNAMESPWAFFQPVFCPTYNICTICPTMMGLPYLKSSFCADSKYNVRLQPTPALTFRVIGGILDFYIFLGPSPDHVISQYTDVIGKPFLPPYWSLGYHQCRFGYNSIDETRKVWKRTRDAGIPFDVQWNDIDYMKNNNDFTFDDVRFAGLPQFVQELHKQGMHYIIMTDPGISGGEKPGTYLPYDLGIKDDVFVKNSTGDLFIGKVWNPNATVFPDFTKPNTFIYWSYLIQKFRNEVAFDGLWIDMNEPSNFWNGQIDGCPNTSLENPSYLPPVAGNKLYYHTLCMSAKHFIGSHYDVHNLFGITEVIATYGALRMIQDIPGPFIISRSSFPGLGVFGGHWTGDVHSDWYNLWKSIGDILTTGIHGIPTVGADICGFNGNTTVPLCNRWMQLGAFYPFSRNHNTDDGIDQDPVAMGDLVVRSSRKALTQRYTMLPYLYSLFFRAHIHGIPVAKPLSFKYSGDSKTYDIDTQFMWGEALMIIPVLEENATTVVAYLPFGIWYDWYSGAVTSKTGGSYLMLQAPLDTIPLLISGGNIIPCQLPGNTTTESRKNPFFLIVALDETQQANGEMFWNNDQVRDPYESKNYVQWRFRSVSQLLTIQVTPFRNPKEMLTLGMIRILGIKFNVIEVTVNGAKVPFKFSAVGKILEIGNLHLNFLKPINVSWFAVN